jgi:soluble lytic murein transglycosylase-like protein
MQLTPETVEMIEGGLIGRDLDPLDPADAVQMGARYLRYLLDRTGSEREAVAAWAQGLAGVQRQGVSADGAAFADAVDRIRRERA